MFVVGWNKPGYLPDSDHVEFEDFDSAKRFLIDEIKGREDAAEDEDEAIAFAHAAEDVNLGSESGISVVVNGVCFFVEPA